MRPFLHCGIALGKLGVMRIGIPKEIKNREHRVALTPEAVAALVQEGHEVRVERGAGSDAGFPDEAYAQQGAQMVSREAAWDADLVVKVKEPLPEEYPFLRPGLVLFTYLHLAADPRLANELCRKRVAAIGYETVQTDDGRLPLLAPMSRIAGRLAVQLGARLLLAENGTQHPGPGRLLAGGVEEPAQVVILGGGTVGEEAARVAHGLGAQVRVLELRPARRRELAERLGPAVEVLASEPETLETLLPKTWLLIGAALVPGARTPRLLDRRRLAAMPPRSVFVDVAIDQGGTSETSRPTSWDELAYVAEGVIHCAPPNMPAAAARTATRALVAATLPYVRKLASLGLKDALAADAALRRGLNTYEGRIVHEAVAKALQG